MVRELWWVGGMNGEGKRGEVKGGGMGVVEQRMEEWLQ